MQDEESRKDTVELDVERWYPDPHHTRGDARLYAQYWDGLSKDDRASLLRATAALAGRAAQENEYRSFAALMQVVLKANEQNIKLTEMERPKRVEHAHLHANVDDQTATIMAAIEHELSARGVPEDERKKLLGDE